MRYLLITLMLFGIAFAEGDTYYLQRNDGSVSDMGTYSLQPLDREDGRWVKGSPPKESQTIREKRDQETKAVQDNEVAKLTEMEARITTLEEQIKKLGGQ